MIARSLRIGFLTALLCLVATAGAAELDRSGPVISLQNTAYQVDGIWYCPLCRQPVPKGDRSKLDLRLQLSEWHDVYLDPDYFRDKIRYISDGELVASLQIPEIEAALQAAAAAGDSQRVSRLLHEHFTRRSDNQRISNYDAGNKRSFITIDEFRHDVGADPARAKAIREACNQVYSPSRGFTLYGVVWGEKIDFSHTYPNASKWGVHYLSFIDALIAGYILDGNKETASAFERLFNQWYDQLDSVKHEEVIHVTTSYDFIWYELGLSNRTERLINALRVFGPELSPETTKRLLKIILGSSRWLDQCLIKTPFHPYNWQTHTAHTLSYAALAFPEFGESRAWLDRGRQNMILHLQNDILEDGGYVERTTSYAAYMFSVFHRYMLMLRYFAGDSSLLDHYMGRLEKFIEFYSLTITPVGVNVPFNDAARGRDLVPLFREMSAFFHRGDFVGAVRQEFKPEELAALPVAPVEPKVRSIDFPQSRMLVMRDSWDPASYFLIFNYGDHQNHSHSDQLSFEIYANGIPIAVDAGLGKLTYLEPTQITWYKHPIAHNMLTINQAVPEKRNLPGYDKIWCPLARTEYFAVSHDGYIPYQKARHRRHLVFAKTQYWLIIDEVSTTGKNQEMEFNLHTPSDMSETPTGFISSGMTGFLIVQDRLEAANTPRARLKGDANLGGLAGEPGYRAIDWLTFSRKLTGNRALDRMATLIHPYANRSRFEESAVSVEQVKLEDPVALAYRVVTQDFEDLVILSDGTQRKFGRGIEGDFMFARIRSIGGKPVYAGLGKVSRFQVPGLATRQFQDRRDHEEETVP
ncbi:MAG: alginate lyase family protein [Opitutaceae bacterium]|nr:alginate lyase family protein [Opitutaceae bacterium]